MTNITWLNPDDFTAIKVERPSGTIELRVNDFITYEGRPDGLIIKQFISNATDLRGPIGMTFLPWRKAEGRWGTPRFTMKGNDHFIICYPVGLQHYGTHINWDTVALASQPLNPLDAL